MEEAPENGKESSNSAHADGTNEWNASATQIFCKVAMSILWEFFILLSFI